MKKKLKNKLVFSKTTIANLGNGEQSQVIGGATTESCISEWPTYCNTQCGEVTCEVTCPRRECLNTDLYTICDKPCVP